jgi:hypothetical protein
MRLPFQVGVRSHPGGASCRTHDESAESIVDTGTEANNLSLSCRYPPRRDFRTHLVPREQPAAGPLLSPRRELLDGADCAGGVDAAAGPELACAKDLVAGRFDASADGAVGATRWAAPDQAR